MNIITPINVIIGLLSTFLLYSTYDLLANDDGWGGLVAAITLLFHIAGLIINIVLLLLSGVDPFTRLFFMIQSIVNFIILTTIVILFATPPALVGSIILFILVIAELIPFLITRTMVE